MNFKKKIRVKARLIIFNDLKLQIGKMGFIWG
jgi:hypothetical protein